MSTCLLWCLWRERNDRNFEDRERMLELKTQLSKYKEEKRTYDLVCFLVDRW
jgi:hypothetical protein